MAEIYAYSLTDQPHQTVLSRLKLGHDRSTCPSIYRNGSEIRIGLASVAQIFEHSRFAIELRARDGQLGLELPTALSLHFDLTYDRLDLSHFKNLSCAFCSAVATVPTGAPVILYDQLFVYGCESCRLRMMVFAMRHLLGGHDDPRSN